LKNWTISWGAFRRSEQSQGEFAYQVRRKVEDEGVRVVVIDSLNGYLTAMTSERFLLAQLHELLAYLNAQEVLTMHLVGHSQIPGRNGGPVEFRAPVRS
jgi:circadian clock protein KaiC